MEDGVGIWEVTFQASLCPVELGLQMSPTSALIPLYMTLSRALETAFGDFTSSLWSG